MDTVDCRGQTYDNATNKLSPYNSLQTKIKGLCHKQTISRVLPFPSAWSGFMLQACYTADLLQELQLLHSIDTTLEGSTVKLQHEKN
jgi:hypothetical protein